MSDIKILIIEDEPQLQRLLQINLEGNDYTVLQATTGKEGILLAASHLPDIILLDLGLPDINGHEVLKDLCTWYTKSILILSARESEEDIITALDNGAADYLSKPFRMGELLARIRSAIKRNNTAQTDSRLVTTNDLEIDLAFRTVKRQGEIIKLTATEYKLLALLAKNEGCVMTHQFILKEIWGVGYQTETQYLRVFIAQLRKKIEENPNQPQHIITESGVGYRFQ